MLNDIMTASAIPAREARFPNPPELHAVYFDSIEAEGADHAPSRIITHDCIVELYAPDVESGNGAKERLVAQLDARGIEYTTQGWHWLDSIRRYQEIIEFTYIIKTGGKSNG